MEYPFASLALLLVVPGSIFAFARYPPRQAALGVLVVSMLFLPTGINFDPPLVPPLDKDSLPALCTLIGLLVTHRQRIRESSLGRGIDLLGVVAMLGVVGTFLTNGDAFQIGSTNLPALGPNDCISDMVSVFLVRLTPFLLGRILIRTSDDARAFLKTLVVGGLVYIPFILIELRMSPQFQNWVYGFISSEFYQSIREGGGYRPMVFLGHGLSLSLFIWCAMVAAWTLTRAKEPILGRRPRPFALLLSGILTLLKSLGALIYGGVVVPLILWIRPRTQLRIASILALTVLLYPLLRASGIFPVQQMTDLAARYSQDRAGSLQFRFDNEDRLLTKALARPWFGWGGWGRSRVYAEDGFDITVTDGLWVIFMGAGGAVLFLTQFGLLLGPIFVAARRIEKLGEADQVLLGGAALLSVVHSVDLLPNAGYANMAPLLAGVVAGLNQGLQPMSAQPRTYGGLPS